MNTQSHGEKQPRSLWKAPAVITALILFIPLLGNRFIDGWHWEFRGFVLVGTILFCTALAFQWLTRNTNALPYRAAFGITLTTTLLLVWLNFIQAADDINPDAVMYLAVPLVAIIGAATARLQPAGMARALFATTLAQTLVLAIALFIRNPQTTAWSPAVVRGFALNGFCAILFFASGLLFRKTAAIVPAARTA